MNEPTNWIRAARKEAGLTQTELADLVVLTPSAISIYETGKGTPSLTALYRIAFALGRTGLADELAPFAVEQATAVAPTAVQAETLFEL